MARSEIDHLKELKSILTPKREELKQLHLSIHEENNRVAELHASSQSKLSLLEQNRFAIATDIKSIEEIISSPVISTNSITEVDHSPFSKRRLAKDKYYLGEEKKDNEDKEDQMKVDNLPATNKNVHRTLAPLTPKPTSPISNNYNTTKRSIQNNFISSPPSSPSIVSNNTNYQSPTKSKKNVTIIQLAKQPKQPNEANEPHSLETSTQLSLPPRPTETSMPASHSVRGWARSTHFVMSLLWHSKVMVPECSLFDENAAIQDHLFVGGHAQPSEWEQYHDNNDDHDNDEEDEVHGSNLSNVGRVLRSTREKTTLDHLFQRLDRKATTPLCAVNRNVGTHGAVLSVAGLNSCLDDLRAKFAAPPKRRDEDEIRPEEDANDFCIQQYIEPIDGVRYEVTCTRQAAATTLEDNGDDYGNQHNENINSVFANPNQRPPGKVKNVFFQNLRISLYISLCHYILDL